MLVSDVALALVMLAAVAGAMFFGICEGAYSAILPSVPESTPGQPEAVLDDPRALRHGIEFGRLSSLTWAVACGWLLSATTGSAALQWFALVLIVGLVMVLANRVCRTVGGARPEAWAGRTAPWLRVWMWLSMPIVVPLARLDRADRVVFDEGDEEALEIGEAPLSVFDLRSTTVREVMTPRPDIVAIPADRSWQEVVELVRQSGRSRIPVYDGEIDRIAGVLYAKDLVGFEHGLADPPGSLEELWWEPTFVPEAKRIDALLRKFQRDRIHLAIVVDEYGGTAGVVTLEDVLEEVVGEIRDEHDRETPLVEPLGADSLRVDGRLDVDDFNELTRSDLDATGVDTIAGLVARALGRIAEGGEEVEVGGWRFHVDAVEGNRIVKITAFRTRA